MVMTVLLVYCVSAILGIVSFFCEWSVVLTICGVINALALIIRLCTQGADALGQLWMTFACFLVLVFLSEGNVLKQELSIGTAWLAICVPTGVVSGFQGLTLFLGVIFAPLNRRADRIEASEKNKNN